MSDSRVKMSITFPDLKQAQATKRLSDLKSFVQRHVGALEFVDDGDEGHLSVGVTFVVMVATPVAALIWRAYFSEFGPRQPGKVRIDVDGEPMFEGISADPDKFPPAES